MTDENSQLKSKGKYKNGKRTGKWTWKNKFGQKQCVGEYKDGLEVGNWIWWNKDMLKIFEGNYKDGKEYVNKLKDGGDADTKLKEECEKIILTTENNPQDLHVEERIEIITAECVLGMNIFRDFFAGIRDIVGGRSAASQKILRDARKICLSELKIEAHSLGADAVIGVDLDYSEFSGSGKSMLFIVASGTAVKLKKG